MLLEQEGEDIPVEPNTKYPYLELDATYNRLLCYCNENKLNS